MARNILLWLVLGLMLNSCSNGNMEYKMTIASYDKSKTVPILTTRSFKASNDTLALLDACQYYWTDKYVTVKIFKTDSVVKEEPYSFFVDNTTEQRLVKFDSATMERLTLETVKRYRDTLIPGLDTIKPRVKEGKANIY